MTDLERRRALAVRSNRFVARHLVAIGFAVFFGLPLVVALLYLLLFR